MLYRFSGQGGDGISPNNLIAGPNGVLYGTTQEGGYVSPYCAYLNGCGTVFAFEPPTVKGGPWIESILYSFTDKGNDGNTPSRMVIGADGNLYGVTTAGGSAGAGTVFRLTRSTQAGQPWSEEILYSFKGTNGDGYAPAGPLAFNASGVIFGTTAGGGGAGCDNPDDLWNGVPALPARGCRAVMD